MSPSTKNLRERLSVILKEYERQDRKGGPPYLYVRGIDKLNDRIVSELSLAVKSLREKLLRHEWPELKMPDGLSTATEICLWEHERNQENKNRSHALKLALELVDSKAKEILGELTHED